MTCRGTTRFIGTVPGQLLLAGWLLALSSLLSALQEALQPYCLQPYSKRRHYGQLPVSGRRMQCFVQFKLSSHQLPVVTRCFSGGHNVPRVDKIRSHCGPSTLADALRVVLECPLLQPLRQHYADLVTPEIDTVQCFTGQEDHMQSSILLIAFDILNI